MSDKDRLPDRTPHPEREIGAIPPGARTTGAPGGADEVDADDQSGIGAARKDGRGDVGGHSDPALAPLGTDAEAGADPKAPDAGGIQPLRKD